MAQRHRSLAALNSHGERIMSNPDASPRDKENVNKDLKQTNDRWNKGSRERGMRETWDGVSREGIRDRY